MGFKLKKKTEEEVPDLEVSADEFEEEVEELMPEPEPTPEPPKPIAKAKPKPAPEPAPAPKVLPEMVVVASKAMEGGLFEYTVVANIQLGDLGTRHVLE